MFVWLHIGRRATGETMEKVFLYCDHSNLFYGARDAAEQREDSLARFRVRIDFKAMMRLAHADRPVERAIAAGSVPPEMRALWNRLEAAGAKVELFDRGAVTRGEQQAPDRILQLQMLRDAADYNGDPGIVVLLTGDGAGFYDGAGFHADVERMHRRGWRIEILSWRDSCSRRMQEWVEENGVFVALDDYYEAVTFLEPTAGAGYGDARLCAELDLSTRPKA